MDTFMARQGDLTRTRKNSFAEPGALISICRCQGDSQWHHTNRQIDLIWGRNEKAKCC